MEWLLQLTNTWGVKMKDRELIAEIVILIVVIVLAIFVACLIIVMISDTQS